jgi:methyl coenzyme M reductase system subunit A2
MAAHGRQKTGKHRSQVRLPKNDRYLRVEIMPRPFISVHDLCMDFDDTRVLNHVSFNIPEGEIMGVIGRSGAGKSVLMHLLRGIEQPPTTGSIVYHMAACDRCTFMDVQSRAGKKCTECGGELVAVDVDLWDAKTDGMKSRVMNRDYVPAHVCTLR